MDLQGAIPDRQAVLSAGAVETLLGGVVWTS